MNFHEVAALIIFCAVVLGTVVTVLVPITVQLPAAWHKHLPCKSVSISYAGIPVAGTLLMLMTGVLDGQTFAAGIVGDESMKPYGIVVLFMALAYMSSSLDMTGCFQWLALHLTRMSKGNGLALFLLYYTLSSILTIFTSNDVSIMALTPIIYYFALATGADPIPFLTAEFTAANIWSMLLFVGNPTNIIVSMAYRLGFLEYSKWMALPTIAAGFAALAAVLAVHWRHIPKQLQLPDLQPSIMLVDKPGAILGSINILACLGLLAAAPALKWELWVVTLVCALLHALYNCIAYVGFKHRWCTPAAATAAAAAAPGQVQVAGQQQEADTAAEAEAKAEAARSAIAEAAAAAQQQQHPTAVELVQQSRQEPTHQQQQQQQQHGCRWQPSLGILSSSTTTPNSREDGSAPAAACSHQPDRGASDADVYVQDAELALRSRTSSHMQLLSVQQHAACSDACGLQHSVSASEGFCAIVLDEDHPKVAAATAAAAAKGDAPAESAASGSRGQGLQAPPVPTFWKAVVVLPWEVVPFVLGMFCVVEGLNANGWVDSLATWLAGGLSGSVWGALFGVGALSVLLANIINNQPMTILMTRVCMSPAFTKGLAAAVVAAGGSSSHAAAVPLASAFAVVIASNTAANFSVMGALAGIMFVNILQQRGMSDLGYLRFSKLMVPAGITSTLVALVVLGAEFVTWKV